MTYSRIARCLVSRRRMARAAHFRNRAVAPAPLLACVFVASLSLSCQKDKNEAPEGREAPTIEVNVPDGLHAAKAELTMVARSYEKARVTLATDQIQAVALPARALSTAATTAAVKLPMTVREPLTNLAEASAKLEKMPKQDADAVREAFGEVSRAYVSLLVAAPELQRGLHVFECPMAQGYKQWVQPGEKMENPYMGSRMLECGVAGKWE